MSSLPITIVVALGLCSSLSAVFASAPAAELEISPSASGSPSLSDGDTRPKDLWERIRSGFRLTEVNPELTRRHERWFLERAHHLNRAIERSRPYLYHIVVEVERRGMPMEIALIPLIESAFNPMAESPKKAAGIWQFIPSTGRVLGLQQNAWYDGRRDVLAATRAALDYLQTLNRRFGSWELALAAYNCGEGCLARAIARNRAQGLPTAYAALPLPPETRHYVPKLLAVRNLVQDPDRSGLTLQAIDNNPYFALVQLTQPMPVRQVAQLANMSLEEFVALNPAFQRHIIHTDSRVILLPVDKVETFQLNLKHSNTERSTFLLYKASKGESLQRIAEQFGVTIDWLKEHNPIKARRGRLSVAQSLYVPSKTGRSHLIQNESISTQTTGVRRRET